VSGVFAAVIAVLTWWACNAFIPLLGRTLAVEDAAHAGLAPAAARQLASLWQAHASNAFNLGGLLGALAAVPLARRLGRRPMFICYFLFSAVALLITFGVQFAPHTRLTMLALVGMGVYGIFGAFTFYLPELFPVRLRATGAGFCYNIGRVIAAAGPIAVGLVTNAAGGSSAALMQVLLWLALVPLLAALLARWLLLEPRGRTLPA
jgi:MFS family permease